jgi:UDP-glucose 4-epimerase
MMNILVTGGAGFVGSHLCERLVEQQHVVVSIDNYSTGSIDNHIAGVKYHNLATNDLIRLAFKPDLIFHLGEYSRVEQSFDDFDIVWQANMNGTLEVLKFAKSCNARLVYAGSSTKFGDVGPNSSPYAFTKSTNTQLVQNFADWYGLDYAITYFYNVYGPREIKSGKYATVIAKFNELRLQGLTLPIVLPGAQQRNFTHVTDIVDGLILVGEQGQGDGYGIGSPEAYSILEVAELFETPIELLPERRGNRLSAGVVTDKTIALGWQPKHDLKTYIKQLLQYDQ